MAQQVQIKVDAERVAAMRRMLADPEQGAAAVTKRFGEGAQNTDEFQAAQRQIKANQQRAREQREAADRQARQREQAQRQTQQTERQREATKRAEQSRGKVDAVNKSNIERKAQAEEQGQQGPAQREGMSM